MVLGSRRVNHWVVNMNWGNLDEVTLGFKFGEEGDVRVNLGGGKEGKSFLLFYYCLVTWTG